MTDPLLYTFRTQPYQHQLRALEKIRKLEGKAGLWCPMRTGKTKIAVDWASIGYFNNSLRRVLIVCPISVIDVWRDEIQKHSPVPSIVTILRDSAAKNGIKIKQMTEATDVARSSNALDWVLINYEMVWRLATKSIRLDEFLARWQPDLVIADEAHKLKNPNSQQSKALMRLGAAAPQRLALTGTPVAKAPLDLFGLFRFIDSSVFGSNWKTFKERYADWQPARYNQHILEVVRYKNLGELTAKTRAHSFRMTLQDAFPEITEPSITNIRTPLSSSARRIYDAMAKEMIAELESGKVATAKIVLEKAMRLRQIASGFVKDEEGVEVDLDDSKLGVLVSLISDVVEQDEKLVVFCCFKHDYHRISERLTTQGVLHVLYTGEQSDKAKEAAKRAFQQDEEVKVIVCQVQSGSLGIDLSTARLTAFYNLDYNWVNYVQAVERTLNVRKNTPRGIYHLLTPATIDVTTLNVLKRRGDLAQALIHNPRSLMENVWPTD